jgi:hypothetical protein
MRKFIIIATILLATGVFCSSAEAVGAPIGGYWGMIFGDINDQEDLMALLNGLNVSWGGIEGDINEQTDIFNLLNAWDVNAEWGHITGDLNNQSDLIDYASPLFAHIEDANGHSWVGQDLRTTASPTFVNLTLSGLTGGRVMVSNAGSSISSDADFTYDYITNLLVVGDYNSADWNSAYDWGNHGIAGYLKRDGTTTLTGNWDVGMFDISEVDAFTCNSFPDSNGLVQSDEFWSEAGGSDTKVVSEKVVFDVNEGIRNDIGACFDWEWHLGLGYVVATGNTSASYAAASDGDTATSGKPDDYGDILYYYLTGAPCRAVKFYGNTATGGNNKVIIEGWYNDQWNTLHSGTTPIPDETWTTIYIDIHPLSVARITNDDASNYFYPTYEVRFETFGLITDDINDL